MENGRQTTLDPELVRERLRGYAAFNEWELEEAREALPHLTVEESVRQYLALCRFARSVAPDAAQVFAEQNIAHRVEMRARFKKIAEAMNATSSNG
jgi:hypothetical protein